MIVTVNEVVPKQFAYEHPRFFCLVSWSGYRSSSIDLQGVQHLLPPALPGQQVKSAVGHPVAALPGSFPISTGRDGLRRSQAK